VTIYAVFLVIMLFFVQSKIHADGVTQFKECVWCGQVNYQFSNECSACGLKQFRDIYFKPDCDKRDAKKKAKCLSKSFQHSGNYSESWVEKEYSPNEKFILPLDHIMNKIRLEREHLQALHKENCPHMSYENLQVALEHLRIAKEYIMEFYGIDDVEEQELSCEQ